MPTDRSPASIRNVPFFDDPRAEYSPKIATFPVLAASRWISTRDFPMRTEARAASGLSSRRSRFVHSGRSTLTICSSGCASFARAVAFVVNSAAVLGRNSPLVKSTRPHQG